MSAWSVGLLLCIQQTAKNALLLIQIKYIRLENLIENDGSSEEIPTVSIADPVKSYLGGGKEMVQL